MSRFYEDRAVAEIDTVALAENFRLLQSLAAANAAPSSPPRTMAVVKANAYGHGISLAVPAFLQAGCDFFAVATCEEALAVRRLAPTADILILGYTPPSAAAVLAQYNLTQTVFSLDYAKKLAESATVSGCFVKIHLKIDGGMCRLGFSPDDHHAILAAATCRGLTPVGIFTHFPVADSDLPATRGAFLRFLSCKKRLAASGFSLFSHAAASAALLAVPATALDGVRPGLALYGIPPVTTALPLRPALTLTAPIIQIHEVPCGTPVGYGGSFVTARPSRIGTLPIGYGDGLIRRFGKAVGHMTVTHGKTAFSAPVAGRICMDHTMLDLTDTPAEVGDRVTVLDDPRPVANALGTIPYEILTSLSQRIIRKRKP
ncbi:MAG: alanine racemase [Clostridia bacterium]|nr:alanine racemase [Clostridia bacterium]